MYIIHIHICVHIFIYIFNVYVYFNKIICTRENGTETQKINHQSLSKFVIELVYIIII